MQTTDKLFNKINKSIFIKLSLIVVIAIVIINLLVIFFISIIIKIHSPESVHKNHLINANTVINEIGLPPTIEKMNEVSKKYKILIKYNGPAFNWISSKKFNNLLKLGSNIYNSEDKFWFHNGYFIIKITKNEHTFYIGFNLFVRNKLGKLYIIVLIFILSIVLVFLHSIIRRMLLPINYLMTGVNKIQNGDFSYQIPISKKDELGRLAESFNQMTILLKKMIKSKDRLLLDVSHELRSPLTRIKLAIEFIKNHKIKKSISDDLLEMEQMILEILESEKMQNENFKSNFKKTDIIKLINEVINNYKNKNPGVVFKHSKNKILLNINELRIKMLFNNILNNACCYSKKNNDPILIEIIDNTDNITIIVKDNGIGIDKKDLPNIFEPFYRANFSRSKNDGGYGLGLYLCKKIVEMHKGEISIKSKLNQGTTIIIKFFKKK